MNISVNILQTVYNEIVLRANEIVLRAAFHFSHYKSIETKLP